MTWKYFLEFLLDMFGALSAGLILVGGVWGLATLIAEAVQALMPKPQKKKNNAAKATSTSPQPSPQRGEGEDDHDINGGAGPTPVTP